MQFHKELGVVVPELEWVPGPSFVFRRQAILDRVQNWQPGRVLEIGCGSGAILYDLTQRKFTGVGVETSKSAIELAKHVLKDSNSFEVVREIPSVTDQFDYLLSFEVLEHIEDDVTALRSWLAALRSGGTCLLSVPADPGRWNVTDVMAGHYRRYSRCDVLRLVQCAGLRPYYVGTCGWPVSWMVERLRQFAMERNLRRSNIDVADLIRGDSSLTARSGVDRRELAKAYPIYGNLVSRKLFALLALIQRRFHQSDKGTSYLVEATKP